MHISPRICLLAEPIQLLRGRNDRVPSDYKLLRVLSSNSLDALANVIGF